jgi:hypothetical protein
MRDEYPKVVASREGSSMVSTWTEYLRLSKVASGTALLEVCMYEPIAEAPVSEDDEDPPLPDEIGGKKVIGVDDEWIVGGDLVCVEDGAYEFDRIRIDQAVEWLKSRYWKVTTELQDELRNALT